MSDPIFIQIDGTLNARDMFANVGLGSPSHSKSPGDSKSPDHSKSPDQIESPGDSKSPDHSKSPAHSGSPSQKLGKYFRTGGLQKLSADGVAAIQDLGIQAVIDLRASDEIERDGHDKAIGGVEIFEIDNLLGVNRPLDFDGADPHRQMKDAKSHDEKRLIAMGEMIFVYRKFANNLLYAQKFAKALQVMSDYETVLFHCAAGKDRTGFLAYLIHSIAGTEPDEILHDYMLSKNSVKDMVWFFGIPKSVHTEVLMETAFTVHPEFLNAARDEVVKLYGGVDGYFDAIGVDAGVIGKIRANIYKGSD